MQCPKPHPETEDKEFEKVEVDEDEEYEKVEVEEDVSSEKVEKNEAEMADCQEI